MIDLWPKEKTTLSIKQTFFLTNKSDFCSNFTLFKEKKWQRSEVSAKKCIIITNYFKLISLAAEI